jgi:hypothetical protein
VLAKSVRLELGDGLPLFTELPRRRVFPETGLPAYGVLGNRASGDGHSRKLGCCFWPFSGAQRLFARTYEQLLE